MDKSAMLQRIQKLVAVAARCLLPLALLAILLSAANARLTVNNLSSFGANTETLPDVSQIAQGDGTEIGDMIGGGGLAAAYDGTTSQTFNASSNKASGSNAYNGKDYSAAQQRVSYVNTHGSNNFGYDGGGAGSAITLTLYAKTGSAPSSGTDGTNLGSIAFTNLSDESASRQITSSDESTQWDYIWVYQTTDSSQAAYAELIFFGRN